VLWAVIYVSVGTAAGSSYRAMSGTLHFASWILLGVLVVFLVAVAFGKRVLHRFERRETGIEEPAATTNGAGTDTRPPRS
jgi:membrane protein DedA with SNARE-associated domain